MESGLVTREWLEGLDPAEFQEVSAMISDIQRERAMARRQKLEQRRSAASKKARNRRYLQLERVKCGKKGCIKCASGAVHGLQADVELGGEYRDHGLEALTGD